MTTKKTDVEKVRDVARLARLAVDESQVSGFAASFRSTLELAKQIEAANTDGVVPMAHPMDLTQRLRRDTPLAVDRRDEFLAGAPEADAEHFLVPRVIE